MLRWPFFRRRAHSRASPDYLDVSDAGTRRQLEKSCGRALPFEAARGVSAEPVREFYLRSADLQTRYPLGLLPVGQKRMAKWLLKDGRRQHEFADEQIIAFLSQTAPELPLRVAETYLISPDWQARFPEICTAAEQQRLLSFLREQFPGWREIRRINSLPFEISEAGNAAQLGANILAHFCYPSGLQQGALGTKSALEAAGVATSCRDVPVGTQTEFLPRRPWLGREVFPVTILQMSPMPYTDSAYQRAGLYRRAEVYRIAYWSWELDTIPVEWPSFSGVFDEIWTPSTFGADAMRSRFAVPVLSMPHPIGSLQPRTVRRAELGIGENEFVFLFMFDMASELDRKNPFGLIRAFRRAFAPDEKVTLLLKVVRAQLDTDGAAQLKSAAEDASNLVVVNELTSRERTHGFMQMCDCYISLHRSEGFGLTMAEAMALAKPVIATRYSGNLDFMNDANSFLVDCKLVPVETQGPNYRCGGRWAEPSEEHAAELMRAVWRDGDVALAKAQQAQADIRTHLAPEVVGRRMRRRMEEVCATCCPVLPPA